MHVVGHPHPVHLGAALHHSDLLILAVAGFFSLWGTYGLITWSNTLMIKGLHGYHQFFALAPLLGFAAYCYSPIQNALVLDHAGHQDAGSAAGVLNALWQLGSVIVPGVAGAVYGATGSVCSAFVTLAAGPMLAALMMLPLGTTSATPTSCAEPRIPALNPESLH